MGSGESGLGKRQWNRHCDGSGKLRTGTHSDVDHRPEPHAASAGRPGSSTSTSANTDTSPCATDTDAAAVTYTCATTTTADAVTRPYTHTAWTVAWAPDAATNGRVRWRGQRR
jgi:hypothetical protein